MAYTSVELASCGVCKRGRGDSKIGEEIARESVCNVTWMEREREKSRSALAGSSFKAKCEERVKRSRKGKQKLEALDGQGKRAGEGEED